MVFFFQFKIRNGWEKYKYKEHLLKVVFGMSFHTVARFVIAKQYFNWDKCVIEKNIFI